MRPNKGLSERVLEKIKSCAIKRKSCAKSPSGEHVYRLPPDSFDQPYCKYCYKSN